MTYVNSSYLFIPHEYVMDLARDFFMHCSVPELLVRLKNIYVVSRFQVNDPPWTSHLYCKFNISVSL